jgi:hypothetical protein
MTRDFFFPGHFMTKSASQQSCNTSDESVKRKQENLLAELGMIEMEQIEGSQDYSVNGQKIKCVVEVVE